MAATIVVTDAPSGAAAVRVRAAVVSGGSAKQVVARRSRCEEATMRVVTGPPSEVAARDAQANRR